MYRPNRIGPYPVLDFDETTKVSDATWNAAGNYDLADTAFDDRNPHFRSATVRDDVDQVQWVQDVLMTLADDMSMTFGVAISGVMLSDLPMLYSGSVALNMNAPELAVEIGCGRASAATLSINRGASPNAISQFSALPAHVNAGAQITHANWQGSFIRNDFSDDGFTENPVILYAALINTSGAAVTIDSLSIGLNIHRHLSDLITHDPRR